VPEGDTIHRTAAVLHHALGDRVVTAFETVYPHLSRIDNDAPVVGRRVAAARAVGKHLLIEFSGGLVLRTHMRMSGRWHVYRRGERWRGPDAAVRIVIATADVVAVAFDVVDAEFVPAASLARHRALARLGPDLLDPSFAEGDAMARLRACGSRPIAEVLLDQRVMSGVGNVFKSEILFVCGVHPWTPTGALDDDAAVDLVRAARRLLQVNASDGPRAANGPFAGRRRTTGRLNPAERLWVYGRGGRPCFRCGSAIKSAKQGLAARTTYWCPGCQRGPGA
jgi:endonuclease-8